jgi:ADP-ribose pyrophosphatase YjhB (NUDIX family)
VYNKFNNIAAAVIVIAPDGIPLVKDSRMTPAYWKFPGGKGEASESAEECAIRELRLETGIEVDFFELEKVYEENRTDHKFVLFLVRLSQTPKINFFGDEGEWVEYYKLEDILTMADFFPNHKPHLGLLINKAS